MTIEPKKHAKMDVALRAPTGRFYADQMVDNPSIRYGFTDDV